MTTSQQAKDYVRTAVRKSGTSFYWAMRMLPPDKRYAMYALYAFCREVDDIADKSGAIDQKNMRLNDWREELARIYQGEPTTTSGYALMEPVNRFQLCHEDFLAVIDGMQSDARDGVRIRDLSELEIYMDQVACSVGRISTRIFGIENSLGINIAKALGEALQLTNILRDVQDDAVNNRLYLPGDVLRDYGLVCDQADNVSEALQNPAIEKACSFLQGLAEKRFAEAHELLLQCRRSEARPAIMMMNSYHRLFLKLVAQGWQNPRSSVSLGWPEKIWVLLRHGIY